MLQLIMSGGQTGVDRAALDAALHVGLRAGGWCPKGRKAEDGVIPDRYPLKETQSDAHRTRTDWNVRDSDGTLLLKRGELEGGLRTVAKLCQVRYGKTLCILDLDQLPEPAEVVAWLRKHGIATLNVAGPRESASPGAYEITRTFMARVLLADLEGCPNNVPGYIPSAPTVLRMATSRRG